MIVTSETYNRAHNILKRNGVITNKSGKYELTGVLPND